MARQKQETNFTQSPSDSSVPTEENAATQSPGTKPEDQGANSSTTPTQDPAVAAQQRIDAEREQKEQALRDEEKRREEERNSETENKSADPDVQDDGEESDEDYRKRILDSLPDFNSVTYSASQDPSVPSSVVAEDVMRELQGLGKSPTLENCREAYVAQGGHSRKG